MRNHRKRRKQRTERQRKVTLSQTEIVLQLHQMDSTLSEEHQFLVDDTPNLMHEFNAIATPAVMPYLERAHLMTYLSMRAAASVSDEYLPNADSHRMPKHFVNMIAPNGIMILRMQAEWLKPLLSLSLIAHEGQGPRDPHAKGVVWNDALVRVTRNLTEGGDTDWNALHRWPLMDFLNFVDALLLEMGDVHLAPPRNLYEKHLYGCDNWKRVLATLHADAPQTEEL